tara:strand:+ start:809 stop:2218 length:1410 start_codon:yes stop_codon:yes gene_type:complete
MKNIFLALFVLFSLNSYSQSCEEKVVEVYNKIISSIGNGFPAPPELFMTNSENRVAYMSSKGISIEYRLIHYLCDKPKFQEKISYVIAHELAHHYLNHTWMFNSGLSYASSIGEFIEGKSTSYEQRKISETQADLYGGFFGQLAGFNTLSQGEQTLQDIYALYGLKNEIKGYPSLKERVEIINSNLLKASNLSKLFDLGNVLLRFGEYERAKKCFEDIIRNNFNSREIYNNLGTVYLLYAISISKKDISKYQYPVFIDYQTRASIETNRSGNLLTESPLEMIKKAKELFLKAKDLDPNYIPADQNLFVIDFLENINNKQARKKLLSQISQSKINEFSKVDFKILNSLINGKKKLKLLKITNGSNISEGNISQAKLDLEQINMKWLEDNKIISSEFILLGLKRPYNKISTSNGTIKINEKINKSFSVYHLGRRAKELLLIKIPENKIDDFNIKKHQKLNYKDNFYLIVKK